jgi:hypothetical protein
VTTCLSLHVMQLALSVNPHIGPVPGKTRSRGGG